MQLIKGKAKEDNLISIKKAKEDNQKAYLRIGKRR